MKGKIPSIVMVFVALALVFSLVAVVVPNAKEVSADPGTLKWSELSTPSDEGNVLLGNDWVGPIAVSPDGETIFAGTYDGNYRLYRSDDDGYTWRNPVTEVEGSPQDYFNDPIQDVVVSPGYDTDEIVVVATLTEVLVSYDRGRIFTTVGSITAGTFDDTTYGMPAMIMSMDAALDADERLCIVVGTYNYSSGSDVFLFQYPMMTWQELDAVISLPDPVGDVSVDDVLDVRFSRNYASDGEILAVVNVNILGAPSTALITKIGDGTWNAVVGPAIFKDEFGVSDYSWRADIGFPDDYTYAPMAGSVFVGIWGDYYWGPMDPNSATDIGDVWRVDFMPYIATSTATDLDVRGRIAGVTPTDTDVCSIAVTGDTAEATIMVGTEGYNLAVTPAQMPVYVSDDGGTSWSAALKPPSGQYWFNVEMGSPAAYCGSGGPESAFSAAIEDYEGSAWNQRGLIDTVITDITDIRPSLNYATDSTLFMVTYYDSYVTTSLWKTADGGTRWERILTGGSALSGALMGIDWFLLVETPPAGGGSVFVAQWGDTTIMGSSDGGNLFLSWITAGDITAGAITAWDVVSATEMWTADDLGNIWHTTDSGANWVDPDDSEITDPIIDIELSPGGSDILCGSDSGEVFLSTDDGLTFERVGTTDIGSDETLVAFDADYYDNSIIYAGTMDTDIYRWEVGESTYWTQISEATYVDYPTGGTFSDMEVTKLWSADDGTLYASDYNNGVVWRSVNPTASPVILGTTPYFEPMYAGLLTAPYGYVYWRLEVVPGSNILFGVGEDYYGDPAVWIFTDTLSGPVILDSPVDGAFEGTIYEGETMALCLLTWESMTGARSYEFEVALDEDFGTVVPAAQMLVDSLYTEGTVVSVYLWPDEDYYWHARVGMEGSSTVGAPLISPWSETWSFTTTIGPGASRPSLVRPVPDEPASLTPRFEWSRVEGATGYELQVATDSQVDDDDYLISVVTGLDKTDTNALGAATAYQSPVTLVYDTTYYWQVKALGTGTESSWSNTGIFTTMEEPTPAEAEATPAWVWVVIAISAILLIAVIVLIVRTRRPV
jgi:hypothetical protein